MKRGQARHACPMRPAGRSACEGALTVRAGSASFRFFEIQTKRNNMMKLKSLLQIIALLAIASQLSACGTPYRASPGWGAGGYSSKDLDSNTVQVNYLTGRSAGTQTITKYVMYRSAEIALERGYDGFRLLEIGGFSVGGVGGYTSSANVKIFLQNRSAAEIAQEQAAPKVKISLIEVGIFQKGVVYSAKDVKEKLESQIQRD